MMCPWNHLIMPSNNFGTQDTTFSHLLVSIQRKKSNGDISQAKYQ